MDENIDNWPLAEDDPSHSTTGDLKDPICSVVDSSMPVHSKASGNLLNLLFGNSAFEGGDQ